MATLWLNWPCGPIQWKLKIFAFITLNNYLCLTHILIYVKVREICDRKQHWYNFNLFGISAVCFSWCPHPPPTVRTSCHFVALVSRSFPPNNPRINSMETNFVLQMFSTVFRKDASASWSTGDLHTWNYNENTAYGRPINYSKGADIIPVYKKDPGRPARNKQTYR